MKKLKQFLHRKTEYLQLNNGKGTLTGLFKKLNQITDVTIEVERIEED